MNGKKNGLVLVGLMLLALMLTGCQPAVPVAPTSTPPAMIKVENTATATQPPPSSTPSPTATPTPPPPTSTDTPLPPTETATLEPTPELPQWITDTFGVKMVLVPAGEFQMGGMSFPNSAEPVHTVFLDSFYIDLYEVTNKLYAECVKASVCKKPDPTRSSTQRNYYVEARFGNFPVIHIGPAEARTYCQWRGGDLPTEAQWEKAARGGIEGGMFPWGNDPPSCREGAVNGANYGYCGLRDTVKVGSYAPNGYGIYDMAGNVWEFVLDWYGPYPSERVENPTGPASGEETVIRGGGWSHSEDSLLVSGRGVVYDDSNDPFPDILGPGDDITGFRCSRSP